MLFCGKCKVPNSQYENLLKPNLYLYFKGSLCKAADSDLMGSPRASPGLGQFRKPQTVSSSASHGSSRLRFAHSLLVLACCLQVAFLSASRRVLRWCLGCFAAVRGHPPQHTLGTCSPVNSVECVSLPQDNNISFINTSKQQQLIYFTPHFESTDKN